MTFGNSTIQISNTKHKQILELQMVTVSQ